MKKLFLLLAVIVTMVAGVSAQTQTIKGTVLSAADKEPLVGATVLPIGGGTGVSTDIDGNFTLRIPSTVKEVRVSYVGMKTVVVPVSPKMTITLEVTGTELGEVVFTGYGSGKALKSVVGSMQVVGDQVFKETPASNFVDALQGQVAGLAINSNSGDPSSTSNSIVIRGSNSLSQDVTPLFICDGAPISESFFTSMNPNDIENVTVLKDAASTAIYGARGANGIILITTKKGKLGEKARVTLRANYGWSKMVADNVDMMNAEQYVQFRDLIGQPVSQSIKDLVKNYGVSTTWRDEMFQDDAPTYSVDATVTGGTESTNYYFSLSHYDMKGIIENSEMRRETLSFSIDSRVNNWFRTGFSGNIGYRKSKANLEDTAESGGLYLNNPILLARMALPYDSPYNYSFDEDGNIVYGSKTEKLHYSGITMPWYTYTYDHFSRNRVTGNMRLYEQITPIKGLVLRAQQAFEGYDARAEEVIDPRKTFYTAMGDKIGSNQEGFINQGSNSESFSRYYQFTYTNTGEYSFNVANKHHARVLVGQEAIVMQSEGFGVATSGTSDVRMNLLNQGTTVTMGNLSYSKWRRVLNSYFANGNYDYDNRYYADFSIRRDGTSQLAPSHRWGTFWAVGAMWNMKNEKFLKETTWLDDLRVHYSYGKTGNSNVGDFGWMGTVGTISPGYGNESSTGISGASNYNLTWESIFNHDFGVNARFFDRLTLTADWYYKRTEDMLYSIPYSLTVGASSGYGNVCKMANKGIEVEVQGDIYKSKDWYVGARVSFNYNRNRILELWDGTDEFPVSSTGLIQKVGDVMSQYYAVRYVGVDPADGKQMWLDKNDNVTKEFPSDAQVCTGKSAYAPWTGGFGFNARWKDLSLSSSFVWQSGKYMVNNDAYFIKNATGFGTGYNQSVDMLNIWTTPGQVTDIPAMGETLTYAGEDTSWLEDASFMRMKNLTISYNLPKKLLNRAGLQTVQLHFTGRNLWTLTDFSGYDPEVQSNMVQFQYPNTRQYEFGIEVSF